ncbi:MAG: hypothetical protein EBT17_04810, partial [Actinobacteria bacterium]|nr:hypothetical protein [Actinomycetota bacterium]
MSRPSGGGGSTFNTDFSGSTTTLLISESMSGRAIDAGTGVTSPTHMLEMRGVSSGTFTMNRRRSPDALANRIIISRYVRVSAPPTSNTPCTSRGARAAATKKCNML